MTCVIWIHFHKFSHMLYSCSQMLPYCGYLDSQLLSMCDQFCQNLPLTHTMVKNSFHRQWTTPSISYITNYQYTTAICWWVCFWWGLFLRPVRRPQVLGCPLNATGRLVQAATLLEIITWLVDDIGHGFSYILWQFECNRASLWAISAWKFQSSAVAHHLPPSTPI